MRACLPVSILDTTFSLALNHIVSAHLHPNLDAISEDALSVKLINSLIAPCVSSVARTEYACLTVRM